MRKLISTLIIISLMLGTISFQPAYATGEQDKLQQVNDKLSEAQKKLLHGRTIEKNLSSQIKTLDKQIAYKENQIYGLAKNIDSTSANISKAQADLDLTMKSMTKQSDSLNNRLRAMYKNGDVGLIEIILGSQNIADFMTNMDMVQKILDNDVEILKGIKAQYSAVAEKKRSLLALENELEYQKNMHQSAKVDLEGDMNKTAALKSQVALSNKELEKQLDDLNKQADELIAKIRAMQGDQAYFGGKLGWPVPGCYRITSQFGYRIHPILHVKKLHTGIDIAVPSNTKW